MAKEYAHLITMNIETFGMETNRLKGIDCQREVSDHVYC
jgi:hypothetical protein